jgi:multimeric flavodoxin WrbA
MHILMISGSRNPEGQTARAAAAFLQGVRDKGGDVEQVFLPEMHLERCRQCEDNGWGICRTEGQCVIEDDLAGLVDKINAADSVVFANPVYFGDLSESLRTFLDRLRRIRFNQNRLQGIPEKPAVGICVAGGSGNGAPECCASLTRVLMHSRFLVLDMVPVRRQTLEAKLPILEATGRWFTNLETTIEG